jgi:hypothetical protein
VEWAERGGWLEPFADIVDCHLALACEGAGVAVENRSNVIGEPSVHKAEGLHQTGATSIPIP